MILYFCLFALVGSAWCYQTGAPCGAYDTMWPKHLNAQYLDSEVGLTPEQVPYKLRVLDDQEQREVTTYQKGRQYTFELTAYEPVAGLLMQARRVPFGMQVGEFVDNRAFQDYCFKHQRCGFRVVHESLTHLRNDCPSRSNCSIATPCIIRVKWRSGVEEPRNSIRVVMTAVQNFGRIYHHVFSRPLSPDRSQSGFLTSPAVRQFTCTNLKDDFHWENWCTNFCEEECCRKGDNIAKTHCRRTCCVKNFF